MSAPSKAISPKNSRARMLRECANCRRKTLHEIHPASGLDITICLECLQRALEYDRGPEMHQI